jgi:hypothetical protein
MHKVTVGHMVGALCCPILARSTFSSVWFFSFTCSFSGSVLLVAVNFLPTVVHFMALSRKLGKSVNWLVMTVSGFTYLMNPFSGLLLSGLDIYL